MPLHSRLLRSVLGLAMLILAACQPSVLPSATPSPTALQIPMLTPTPAVLETVTPASPTPTPAVLETAGRASPTPTPAPLETITPASPTPTPEPTPEEKETAIAVFGYTYQQPDGNRLVAGRGRMPDVEPVDLQLAGKPRWLVAVPLNGSSVWVVALEDGRVQGFRAVGRAAETIAVQPEQLLVNMPPLLQVEDTVPTLVIAPSPEASLLSHPVVLNDAGRLAFIDDDDALVVWEGGEVARLALNALPDARLLVDEARRLLLLTDATTRYGHGVLGDGVEAASITLVERSRCPVWR